ncbi:hypothetical protein [Nocardia arthritidis]|uniref:Uncharacterized protein n=1 Tax=Nocardia arthritidis TaxID=228602 RepID=A0A6G9Y8E5_9NOCA|nr:hypothetical protein [Nocardia arthritidis]QIS09390.1 hypothetical protein F5544_07420 [Nocardia arthritidis]
MKTRQYGVKIGRNIRPLPNARNATDAAICASRHGGTGEAKAIVVYRNSDRDLWRTWRGDQQVPTQLDLDLSPRREDRL